MDKVIVEKPRRGSYKRGKPRKGWNKNLKTEDLPINESMRKRYGYNRKELNEHLSPLRRWIRKQCGRPWNDVWSEICSHINPNNAVQQHIKSHVWDFVEKNTIVGSDGEIYFFSSCKNNTIKFDHAPEGYIPIASSRYSMNTTYICPKTGILKAWPRKAATRKPLKRKIISPKLEAHHLDGEWYLLYVKPLPSLFEVSKSDAINNILIPNKIGNTLDVHLDITLFDFIKRYGYRTSRYSNGRCYCWKKVKMSRKDIKKYKINTKI